MSRHYNIGDTVCLINHPSKPEGIVVDITDGKSMGLPHAVQKMINCGYVDNFYYKIQYNNQGLIPPADWHREKSVTLVKRKGTLNGMRTVKAQFPTPLELEYPKFFEHVCPYCETRWHKIEHPIFGKREMWKDCLKCKDTAENLLKKYMSEPPPLEEIDQGEIDDFGYYHP